MLTKSFDFPFLVLQVHPSLIINMDQTGVRLVPSSNYTYEKQGNSSVGVVGAEDKRQITVCLASSMDGDLLPLQLIFEGKTSRSLPPATPASIASQFHLTFSDNHWSSQETMQQYIMEVLIPYSERCITQYKLRSDSKIILVLDVWSVHKSEEFRKFLRTHFPRIHLVFVPANCTSKLQVADVMLQRPFKAGIARLFNQWAAQQIRHQISNDLIIGLQDFLKMNILKPLIVEWCLDSWTQLKEKKDKIIEGWNKCCFQLYDVNDPIKRQEAVAAVAKMELDARHVPNETEQDQDQQESDHEEDEDEDELDLTIPAADGKRSTRDRKPTASFGYQIDSSAIHMTDDSS